ncbi:MAG: OsmC family peroxiredoxin [Actinomycetota bacterium]|nr:OsmC family peroxiredoxin [Actinomycetota bacterium]
MTDHRASTHWTGDIATGQGELSLDNCGAGPFTVSLSARAGETAGETSPEELLAAAHSTCLAMSFAALLAEHDLVAGFTDASATVSTGKTPDGWAITAIALSLQAQVDGLDDDRFQKLAAIAEKTCPVSKALSAAPITMSASLLP